MSVAGLQLGDAVNQLVDNPLPVLFIDTCALLDLIRLPFREPHPTPTTSTLNAAQSILEASSKKNAHLTLPPLVAMEWQDNAQNVKSESIKHFNDLESKIGVAKSIAKFGGQNPSIDSLKHLNLPDLLFDLSQNILMSSISLAQDDEISLKANARAIRYDAPARKGAIKDCVIYEHSLSMMHELRQRSFEQPIAFLTSNTKDFCESDRTPKEPIKTELSALNVELVTRWDWALNALNLNPENQ